MAKKKAAKRSVATEANAAYGRGNWVRCKSCPLNGGDAAVHHPDAHSDPEGFRYDDEAPRFIA